MDKTWLGRASKVVSQIMIIGTAISLAVPVLLTLVAFLFGDFVKQEARDLLGIDQLATKEDLHKLENDLREATGKNRIIRMPANASYVEEPVYQDELIKMHLVLQRTQRGRQCIYVTGRALFTGVRGIPLPGDELPPIKQISVEPEKLLLDLTPPKELLPGRTQINLSLEYVCEGRTVFEQTDPVFFYLEERAE